MAKNKPKNQEHDLKTELHKESKKPNPSPIINKKAQHQMRKEKTDKKQKHKNFLILLKNFKNQLNCQDIPFFRQ